MKSTGIRNPRMTISSAALIILGIVALVYNRAGVAASTINYNLSHVIVVLSLVAIISGIILAVFSLLRKASN
jgi:hypothetical protein